jgi:hypothetical protein
MKNKITLVVLTSVLLFFMQSCVSIKDRFKGEAAKKDQIYVIDSGSDSVVWKTKDLSVNFLYKSTGSDDFSLNGNIIISDYILNSYPVINRFILQVSFLDNNGTVVRTEYIKPMYSKNSIPPEKIKFSSNTSLPDEAVAFCFSYSGKFKGDDKTMGYLSISNNPFR